MPYPAQRLHNLIRTVSFSWHPLLLFCPFFAAFLQENTLPTTGSVFGFWVNFGKLDGRAVAKTAMRPLEVVFLFPLGDLSPGVR
jgi:hypothetical protein